MEMIKTEGLTFSEAKNTLLKKEKKEELGHEQNLTLEHLRKLKLPTLKDVESAKKELQEKVPVLKDHQISMLLSLLPEDKEDLDVLFMKERINLTNDQVKAVLESIDKIRPEKKK